MIHPAAAQLLHLLARQDPDASGTGTGAEGGADGAEGTDGVEDVCAPTNYSDRWGLRIGAIFVILVTSLIGTLTPIILRRVSVIPRSVWEFAKFFGSGVIIATAFIHLLAPAWDSLTSECLIQTHPVMGDYDWAPAIAMMAVYFIFFAEIAAYRAGTARLEKLGMAGYANHGDGTTLRHTHSHAPAASSTPAHAHDHDHAHDHATASAGENNHDAVEGSPNTQSTHSTALGLGLGMANEKEKASSDDLESGSASSIDAEVTPQEAGKQLVGVAVLEFGVVLHSIIIGLTLAVNDQFVILFIVIIFHQMFEGLGLGSRLAVLRLPAGYGWIRYATAVLYCICTPIGMAAGLGAISSFNGNSAEASLATGVLDAFSAGILLYTGLVELIAHEILFNPRMMRAGVGKLVYVFGCMCLGSGIMALLGRWA